MKLFYAPGSSSLLPHIVLHEAELPFEPVRIDEHTKAITGGGDYMNVNPLGYEADVWPVLTVLRGKVMMENGKFFGDVKDGKLLKRKVAEGIRSRPAL